MHRRSTTPGGALRIRAEITAFFGDYHLLPPDWFSPANPKVTCP